MARVSYETINASSLAPIDRAGGPLRRLAEVLRNAMLGKLNIGGTTTLSGTSTVLTDQRIGGQSLLFFMATNAAAAPIVPTIWIGGRDQGQATLHHGSASNVSIEYIIIG